MLKFHTSLDFGLFIRINKCAWISLIWLTIQFISGEIIHQTDFSWTLALHFDLQHSMRRWFRVHLKLLRLASSLMDKQQRIKRKIKKTNWWWAARVYIHIVTKNQHRTTLMACLNRFILISSTKCLVLNIHKCVDSLREIDFIIAIAMYLSQSFFLSLSLLGVWR